MRSIRLGKYSLEIEESVEPNIETPDQVKVKLCYSSFCGNDMLIYKGKMAPYYGNSIGLESSGIVIDKGENVTELSIGDHVAMELLTACGKCEMCKSGKPQYCLDIKSTNGQMKEYAIYSKEQLVKVDKDIDLKEVAFMEPLALCLKSIEAIPNIAGKKILILGAGTFGLITLKLLKRYPVATVAVADPHDNKRKLALSAGADKCFNSKTPTFISDAMDYVDCIGYDAVIETSGNPLSANIAPSLVARGGIAIFNALYGDEYNLPLNLFTCYWKDMSVRCVYPPTSEYYYAARGILKSLHLSDLITAIYPFEEAKDAIYAKANGGQVKVLLDFTEERKLK